MRSIRRISTLLLTIALAVGISGIAHACTVSSAKVAGTFDENGHFVVTGALDADGTALDKVEGFKFTKITTADNVAITASDFTNRALYVVGDMNFDDKTLHVASYTDCAKTAATVASAGSSCSASKAASAKVASAGSSSCSSSKAASAKVASAGSSSCSSSKAASAKVASAGSSSCSSSKAASAKVAGAGAGCASKSASLKVAGSPSCCPGGEAKGASAKVAAADATPTAREDVTYLTYNVSGMKCGKSCVAKVEAAVAALEMDGIAGCEVNFEDARAIVTVTKDVDTDAIKKAITSVGYEAEYTEEKPGDETATK